MLLQYVARLLFLFCIGLLYLCSKTAPAQRETSDRPRLPTGSGFIVSADGYILTCHHVVAEAVKLEVVLGDKKYLATIVKSDEKTDLALIKIDAQGLKPLRIGNSDTTRRQEEVWAFGFPLGTELGTDVTTTKGTITAIRTRDGQKAFQTDAAINLGNSGGPLVNNRGEVIGVVNMKVFAQFGGVEGIAFAVPIATALPFLKMIPGFDEQSIGTADKKLDGVEIDALVSPSVPLIVVTPGKKRPDAPSLKIPDYIKRKNEELKKAQEEALNALKQKGVTPPADMVLIPAGEFIMGKDDGEDDEKPAHKVYLDAYWIDKYEVTNEQYAKFLDHITRTKDHSKCHPNEPRGKNHTPKFWKDSQLNQPKQPVVGVDWFDAYAYAHWAGKRLPTEAEWEKAARGTDERDYPWGNDWIDELANVDGDAPREVGSFPDGASPYGVMDMAGNVWEWCADWYDFYRKEAQRNPQGPPASPRGMRVLRGGSWHDDMDACRAPYRMGATLLLREAYIGFRCAKKA
ncbi:MAG: SUMF1/EgtB/PvdO family nonheme iron enzyme [Abditibacteriales bacterium]|nr:SUMF1/EgtB/PvdO family nonheme iron enzyme [Abditibacteriales bacterium]MDW8367748.1 SUMF1/EgtB/PvdO family nonheme iron enzyme [Abditibacteriales bacterium]